MRICFLTQTATDISEYHREFFKEQDLFFLTFKSPNPQAIDFLPKSTWSHGRNRLWEVVKDKYDYYVFFDDDIRFYRLNPLLKFSPRLTALILNLAVKRKTKFCFKQSGPDYFISHLKQYLTRFKPEVLAVNDVQWDPNIRSTKIALAQNSYVRRLGFFDAQFMVVSNYAASKILPYDTKISGWWSAHIPVYLYAFHVFAKKAINVFDLGVMNTNWTAGGYVAGYDGFQDCVNMLAEISAVTAKDFLKTAGPIPTMKYSPVNNTYGKEAIESSMITEDVTENYRQNYENSLKGLENFLHPHLVP